MRDEFARTTKIKKRDGSHNVQGYEGTGPHRRLAPDRDAIGRPQFSAIAADSNPRAHPMSARYGEFEAPASGLERPSVLVYRVYGSVRPAGNWDARGPSSAVTQRGPRDQRLPSELLRARCPVGIRHSPSMSCSARNAPRHCVIGATACICRTSLVRGTWKGAPISLEEPARPLAC